MDAVLAYLLLVASSVIGAASTFRAFGLRWYSFLAAPALAVLALHILLFLVEGKAAFFWIPIGPVSILGGLVITAPLAYVVLALLHLRGKRRASGEGS